jgi:hypothetical protein
VTAGGSRPRAPGLRRTIAGGWAIAALLVAAPDLRAQQEEAPPWPDPPHQLLIVGTFHFSDPGLDAYRPSFDVDILAPERQAEVLDLVERLAGFRPTRVAVEAMPARQPALDEMYAEYLRGERELGSNEIQQLGFRLASEMGHDRVYAVDAERRFYQPWVDPDSFAVANGQRHRLDPDLQLLYGRQSRWEDEAKTHRPLRETLLSLNDPERALRSHGQYLIGNFEVGTDEEYPGVDSKTAWFNRNLRIFANLQRLLEDEHERIVLIVGAGHVALLRHAAEASPQFELVELADVLGEGP